MDSDEEAIAAGMAVVMEAVVMEAAAMAGVTASRSRHCWRGANRSLSRTSQRFDHGRIEHGAQAPPARRQCQNGTCKTAKKWY